MWSIIHRWRTPKLVYVTAARISRQAHTIAILAIGWCTIAAALEGPPPVHVPSEDADAHILQRTYPTLPESGRSQHIAGGTVGLEVTISSSGSVSSVRRIIGDPTLGEAASQAVRGWKYRPFLKDGVPVEVVTVQTVIQNKSAIQETVRDRLVVVWGTLFSRSLGLAAANEGQTAVSSMAEVAFVRRVGGALDQPSPAFGRVYLPVWIWSSAVAYATHKFVDLCERFDVFDCGCSLLVRERSRKMGFFGCSALVVLFLGHARRSLGAQGVEQ